MANDYRGWLQKNGYNWALKYAGNDYNNGYGGGDGNALKKLEFASKYGERGSLPGVGGNVVQEYNQRMKLIELGKQYASIVGQGKTKPTSASTSSSSGGGGGTGRVIDPNVVGQFDTGIRTIQDALGRLPGQLDIANKNISRRYGTNLNEIESAKTKAKGARDTSTTQNQQNYRTDKNSIADAASAGLRGLLRVIGSRGAGGSSEAMYNAPEAVTDQANSESNQAGQTYAENQSTIDTNWKNFLDEDKQSRRKLNDWRDEQRDSAESQSLSTKQDLLTKLAELNGQKAAYIGGSYEGAATPFLNEAKGLATRIDKFAAINPSYDGKTATYEAPSLSSYIRGGQNAVVSPTTSPNSDTPFLSMILQQDKKKKAV